MKEKEKEDKKSYFGAVASADRCADGWIVRVTNDYRFRTKSEVINFLIDNGMKIWEDLSDDSHIRARALKDIKKEDIQ